MPVGCSLSELPESDVDVGLSLLKLDDAGVREGLPEQWEIP